MEEKRNRSEVKMLMNKVEFEKFCIEAEESGFSKSKENIGFTPSNLDKMGMSSKFPPTKLSDGDHIKYFIPIEVVLDSIKMPSSIIQKLFFLNCFKVYTTTTTDKTFKSKIGKQLKKIIKDYFDNK